MSTKSRRRAQRRHPELASKEAMAAVGASLVALVTLGMIESADDAPPPTSRARARHEGAV